MATITISADGKHATRHGMDEPANSIISFNERTLTLVAKIPGHKYWAGHGDQSYAPVEHYVVKLQPVHGEDLLFLEETTDVNNITKWYVVEQYLVTW